MPYYLETDDRDLLKKLRLYHLCQECGGELEALYDLKRHLPYIQCKATPGHEGIEREPSRYEMGGLATLNIEARRNIMVQTHGVDKANAMEKYQGGGQLTKEGAMEVLKLVYPDCPETEIIRTAMLCRDFGLHPLMKEVYLIPFNKKGGGKAWATVIGITANRKIASSLKGVFSFLDDTPRAASKAEIVKQFGTNSHEEEDNIISICRLRGERGNTANGFGLYPKKDNPYGTDKGNTPRNMANIRAERQALDRLPGDAMPLKGFDVIDEAYAEPPVVTITTESGEVDTGTGEIIETTAEPVADKPEHWCEEHGCEYDRHTKGTSIFYSHLKEGGGYCNEIKSKKAAASDTPEKIRAGHIVKLEKLAKEKGANIGELVKAKGWPATKPTELSFDQAQVLIDDLTGIPF